MSPGLFRRENVGKPRETDPLAVDLSWHKIGLYKVASLAVLGAREGRPAAGTSGKSSGRTEAQPACGG